MQILTASRADGSPRTAPSDSPNVRAWRLLGWIGVAFAIMGLTDILLAWYPAAFGRPEWEFGAISASLNGLALPLLGLFLCLAATLAQRRQGIARGLAILLFVIAVALLALAFIYVTVIPLALNAVSDNAQLAAGMKKAIVKATILFATYVTLLVAGGIAGWRQRTDP